MVSDAVSRELDITGNVEYLPLDISIWKDKIIDNMKMPIKRKNMIEVIRQNGFDIQYEAKNVESIIAKICEENN